MNVAPLSQGYAKVQSAILPDQLVSDFSYLQY